MKALRPDDGWVKGRQTILDGRTEGGGRWDFGNRQGRCVVGVYWFFILAAPIPHIAGAGSGEEEKLVVGAAVEFPFLLHFFLLMCLYFSLFCSD